MGKRTVVAVNGGQEHARTLRRALNDPKAVCERLGLLQGAKRQRGGVLVRCPAHGDRDPSCSISIGADGTLRVRCFGCDLRGDVLNLVAAVHRLDVRHDFPRVLIAAAELAHEWHIVEAIEGRQVEAERRHRAPPAPQPRPASAPLPERDYPPAAELGALWDAAVAVTDDEQVAAWLEGRALNPEHIAALDVARALPLGATLPRWARYSGRTWLELGHRLLMPMFDASGTMRTVRARRVCEGDSPKALPPSGHRMAELVMACGIGREVLELGAKPSWWPEAEPLRLVVAEGEPDTLSWATREPLEADPTFAVLGLESGSWCEAVAARIPDGSKVIVRTHHDGAGDKYAKAVAASLAGRCILRRARP
jgi:hypothetical protein